MEKEEFLGNSTWQELVPGRVTTEEVVEAPWRDRLRPTWATVHRFLPVIRRAKHYTLQMCLRDVIAGLTVGVMVVPTCIAYAKVAGLDISYGLYTSYPAPLVYCLFGTSNVVTLGPAGVLSLVVGQQAGGGSDEEVHARNALLISFLAGIIQVFLGLTRMGAASEVISKSVIRGFCCAASLLVTIGQIPNLIGLDSHSVRKPVALAFIDIFSNLGKTKIGDVLVTICSIAVLQAFAYLSRYPRLKVMALIRSSIIVMLGTLITFSIPYVHDHVTVPTGNLNGLPPIFVPSLTVEEFQKLVVPSLVIALIGYIEGFSIAKTFARVPDQESKIDPNQELIAMGMSNFVGSFLSAFPVSGSFARSTVSSLTGVRTPFSGVVVSSVVLIVILALRSMFKYIPVACLSSIMVVSILHLFDWKSARRLFILDKPEFAIMMLTFLVSLFDESSHGILAGVMLSLITHFWGQMNPKNKRYVTNVVTSGGQKTKVSRIHYLHPLMFASVSCIEEQIEELAQDSEGVEVDFADVLTIDFCTAETLLELQQTLAQGNVALAFRNMNTSVREMFEKINVYSQERVRPSAMAAESAPILHTTASKRYSLGLLRVNVPCDPDEENMSILDSGSHQNART